MPRSHYIHRGPIICIVLVLLGMLSARAAHAGGQCGDLTWASTGIPARYGHATAFDAARSVVVLFGGTDGLNKFGDTATWNGTSWTHLDATGPSARNGHSLAYDAAHDRVILFGGLSEIGSGFLGDTWEWTGTSWHQLAPANSPTPRHDAAMCYDSARHRIVLFGGDDVTGAKQSDTWEWDGSNWLLRASTGPAARSAHAIAFDSSRGRTVLFGGSTNSGPSNDTWEWDGSSWSQLSPASLPPARFAHSLTYDAVRHRTVLIGGYVPANSDRPDHDVWEWDGANWAQLAALPGVQRMNHAASFDSARGTLVLTGGATEVSALGDTWERSGTAWTQAASFSPAPRTFTSMVYDAARQNVVLFGGSILSGPGSPAGETGATWIWNGSSWTERNVSGPGVRIGSPLAYDALRQRVVLFSGDVSDQATNDTWEWDGMAWALVHAGGAGAPPMRQGHGFVYDAARNECVLFGGSGRFDTWTWNGSAWTNRPVAGPSGRTDLSMAFDAARQKVVLFGGFSVSQGDLGDTWEWDGSTWSLRATTGPAPGRDCPMAYDADLARVVLVAATLTWSWDGNSWHQLQVPALPNSSGAGMTFDAASGQLLLFGGDPPKGQTFVLGASFAPPSITRQPVNTIVVSGDSVVIDLEAAGGEPLSYQWRKDRVSLANSGPFSGVDSPALAIDPAAPELFGVYDCVVTNACGTVTSDPVALSVLPAPNPCPADFNSSGDLNSQDFFDFLNAFFSGCP